MRIRPTFGLLFCSLLFACARGVPTATSPVTYRGTLPCADCAGIATALTLDGGERFTLRQTYLGRQAETAYTEEGRYRVSGKDRVSGKRVSLERPVEMRDRAPSRYRLEPDGTLVQLDLGGETITGELADRYRLRPDTPADAPPDSGEVDLYVNSARVPCTGVGEQTCFEVQRGESTGAWELFYQPIEGFDYRPGRLYHLRVREIQLDPATVPADASSLRYELVRTVDARPDARLALTDTWALEAIAGQPIAVPGGSERPTLELDVSGMSARGTDGCNGYSGEIERLGGQQIELGSLVSTEMACPDMSLADRFGESLLRVRRYRRVEGTLVLLEEGGGELLRLRHVD